MSAPDEQIPPASESKPAPVAETSKGMMVGMALGYLLVGLLAASAARLFSPSAPTPAAKEVVEAKETHAKPKDDHGHDHGHDKHGHSEAEAAHHAVAKAPATPDEAMRAGRFQDALEMARKAKAPLQEGAALEALGKWNEAATAYESAIDPDGDPGRWAAASLGAARTALAMNDIAKANALISKVALRSGQPGCRAVRAGDEAVLLRAQLTVQRLGTMPTPDPRDGTATEWPDLGGGLDHYPVWVTAAPPHRPAPESAGTPVRVVPNAAHPDRYLVTAELTDVRPAELLQKVTAAAKMRADVQPAAVAALTKTTIGAEVDGLPLADLVAAVVEPLGLGWRITADTVSVTAAPPPTDRKPAREALRRAVATAPTHPKAKAARLAAANLAFADGRTKEAIDEFRRLMTDAAHSPEAGPAARNLGLALLATGDPTAARAAFLQSIDRAATEADTAAGWWWVGRTHLDSGDAVAAMKPLRQALNGPSKSARSTAIVGLAVAHLLRDDTDEAEAVMKRNPIGPGDKQAEFLEALFRFRGNPSPLRGETLLAAARAADDGRPLGPAGVFLAGQA